MLPMHPRIAHLCQTAQGMQVGTSLLGIGYGSWPWQFLFDGFVWGSMRLIIEKIGFG